MPQLWHWQFVLRKKHGQMILNRTLIHIFKKSFRESTRRNIKKDTQ
jgi:hypothetical protein